MTLEKLAELRDNYADKVQAYQDAQRSDDKKAITKTRAAMKRSGKSYLKGIDKARLSFTETEVDGVMIPK